LADELDVPDEAEGVLEADEHPAAARTEAVTMPVSPASMRSGVRRCLRFMATEFGQLSGPAGDVKLTRR
jgi:hypothetical protein